MSSMDTLKKLVKALKDKELTISIAESMTGGYVSYLLTKTPGASEIFKGGYIVYSLDTKEKLFNIKPSLLKKTQGVSKTMASALSEKVRKKLKADIGAAIVGFAGPTTKKGVKVGTTYLAVATTKGVKTKKYVLKGSRDIVRKKAAELLINFIYENILHD